MHVTIEKTFGIVLSLVLCLGIVAPLVNTSFNLIGDFKQNQEVTQLINKVDYGVKLVVENNVHYVDEVFYPTGVTLWSENTSIYWEFNGVVNSLHYSIPINVSQPSSSGEYLMYIFNEAGTVLIRFIR